MVELNLEVNEYVAYEYEEHMFFEKKGGFLFYVTNLHVILVKEEVHFLRKSTYQILKFPIRDIRQIDGAPQVALEEDEDEGTWDILILFYNGLKRFSFEYGNKKKDKVKIEKIAEIITQLSSRGTIVLKEGEKKEEKTVPATQKVHEDKSAQTAKKPSLMEKLSSGMKSIIGAVTGDKDEAEQPEQEKHKYCLACNAKIDIDARFCPNCGAMQSSGR